MKIDCIKSGNHDLEFIYGTETWEKDTYVRWCKNCGAIVVDVEYDGRLRPGEIMKMKYPEITRWYK